MITYPNGEFRRPAGTSPDTAQGTNEHFQNKPCTGFVCHLRQSFGVSFGKTHVSFFGKRAKYCPFGVNHGNTGWDTCLFRSLWLAKVTLIRVSGCGGCRDGEFRGHILPRSSFSVGESLAGNVSRHKNHACFAKKRVSCHVSFEWFWQFYIMKGPCWLPCYYGSIGAGDRLSILGAVRRNEQRGGFGGRELVGCTPRRLCNTQMKN
jgi:hypothetical protein